jgi:hypothetical protein
MLFDTKIAILVAEDLAVWQKLNVTAFVASGIAAAAPLSIGEPYEDVAGNRYAPLFGQPVLVFAAKAAQLARAWRNALDHGLTCAAYTRAMFSTGHDAANRTVFKTEAANPPDLVGLALRGPRKDVDRATKGCALHS